MGPHGEDNTPLEYFVRDPHAEGAYNTIQVQEFLKSLDGRERQLVELRLNGFSQQEIAVALGITQPHVSRLLSRIQRRYRSGQYKGGRL